MTEQSVSDRARYVFERVRGDLEAEMNDLQSKARAAGALYSGNTIKLSLRIFEEVGSNALDECHRSVSVRYKHRGTKWKKAMGDVEAALNDFVTETEEFIVERYISDDNFGHLFRGKVPEVRAFLLQRHTDRELGWTGPEPQPWHQRHPILYAVGTALLSGLVSLAVALAAK